MGSVHFRAAHMDGSSPFFEQDTLKKTARVLKSSQMGGSKAKF